MLLQFLVGVAFAHAHRNDSIKGSIAVEHRGGVAVFRAVGDPLPSGTAVARDLIWLPHAMSFLSL